MNARNENRRSRCRGAAGPSKGPEAKAGTGLQFPSPQSPMAVINRDPPGTAWVVRLGWWSARVLSNSGSPPPHSRQAFFRMAGGGQVGALGHPQAPVVAWPCVAGIKGKSRANKGHRLKCAQCEECEHSHKRSQRTTARFHRGSGPCICAVISMTSSFLLVRFESRSSDYLELHLESVLPSSHAS